MFAASKGSFFIVACLILTLVGACSSENSSTEGAAQETRSEQVRRAVDGRIKPILLRGERAFQRGAYQRALALADSAAKYEPELAVIHFFRGSVYSAQNRLDAAKKAYQKAIELDSSYPEVRLRMGDNERQLGNLREALRLYRQEERVTPSSSLYVQMGQTYAELGIADSARMAYDKAVALDSTDANVHMMYGQFLEETGNLEAALTHSRKALSIEPDRPNYQFAVGSQLFQLGRLEEAAEYLRQAADGRLLHYPAQYNMGQVLMRMGREQEADKYLARADSARQLMDQITAAQSVASRDPGSVDNWVELGELFRKAGERNRAVQAYNRAASLQPTNLRVQNKLGEMMLAEGRTQQALQRFQNILSVDETRADVWINLGLAHAVAGNCTEARQAWNTALQHRPDDPTARKYLDGLCQYSAQ